MTNIPPPPYTPEPDMGGDGDIHLDLLRVFVRGLKIDARVGVHHHEQGRTQPLILEVELEIDIPEDDRLDATVNYQEVADLARRMGSEEHVNLVEIFAERLARTLLDHPQVRMARVKIDKPEALAPDAEAAGAEIILARG